MKARPGILLLLVTACSAPSAVTEGRAIAFHFEGPHEELRVAADLEVVLHRSGEEPVRIVTPLLPGMSADTIAWDAADELRDAAGREDVVRILELDDRPDAIVADGATLRVEIRTRQPGTVPNLTAVVVDAPR